MTGGPSHRRRTIQAFYLNGACWGLGNGLVSSSLIIYLAGAFGAAGFAVSLILATPRLVGVLRLATPILIDLVGRRKKFCVRMFLQLRRSCFFCRSFPLPTCCQVRSGHLR